MASLGTVSNQREKVYTLFHRGSSFKKKVLKYGTPKPRERRALLGLAIEPALQSTVLAYSLLPSQICKDSRRVEQQQQPMAHDGMLTELQILTKPAETDHNTKGFGD